MDTTTRPRALTIAEVQERLNIGRTQAYAITKNGQLRSFRVGSSVRVTPEALDDFIRSQESS